jgi:hypothetical protein
MRSLRSLTRPNAKPTSGPTVDHDRSAGGSSDDRPCRLLHCGECNAQSRRIRRCLARGSAPTSRRASADSLSSGRPRRALQASAAPARPDRKRRCLGLSGNRLGFRSQWMDSRSARRRLRNGAWACVHRCERRQAVRPASIDCTARASTPQCAPPPAADHGSDVGCSREGAANTYTNRSARLARVGSTSVRPLHPHAVHRADEAGATRIEHAWSNQHCEATRPPFSQADRAWREVALLQQA